MSLPLYLSIPIGVALFVAILYSLAEMLRANGKIEIEKFKDEVLFLLPVIGIYRGQLSFGWLKWHWLVRWKGNKHD